jgi:SAM-dependent methyltransferase
VSETLKASGGKTEGVDYTDRLQRLSGAGWKRALNVQAPYRWNIRRLDLGFTLDVGCGIGRNLSHLDGNGVGVDHNATSIAACRAAGLTAFTIEDFFKSEYATPGRFDAILGAHLIEHVEEDQAKEIIASYLPFLRSGGRAVFITPQERGFASDATHVRFSGFDEVGKICTDLGLTLDRQYSFPFPRPTGKVFTYNEFVTVARKP